MSTKVEGLAFTEQDLHSQFQQAFAGCTENDGVPNCLIFVWFHAYPTFYCQGNKILWVGILRDSKKTL